MSTSTSAYVDLLRNSRPEAPVTQNSCWIALNERLGEIFNGKPILSLKEAKEKYGTTNEHVVDDPNEDIDNDVDIDNDNDDNSHMHGEINNQSSSTVSNYTVSTKWRNSPRPWQTSEEAASHTKTGRHKFYAALSVPKNSNIFWKEVSNNVFYFLFLTVKHII
jgi:hypothetical protein